MYLLKDGIYEFNTDQIEDLTKSRGKDGLSGQLVGIFEIISFCLGVAICDIVHDVEAIFHFP